MILIADSGSSKTHWAISDKRVKVRDVYTKGINPYYQTKDEIYLEISQNLAPLFQDEDIEVICFFGAGCAFPDKIEMMTDILYSIFPSARRVYVDSDLMGACYALCRKEAGIACILGTGSNSCFFNGTKLEKNISPLGFILGDEGSGAVMGKLLVADILKNQIPLDVRNAFFEQYDLSPSSILEKVYRQPFPNRFLATFSRFIVENLDNPAIYRIVYSSFCSFFQRNVYQYPYQSYPVHIVGSVGYYYRSVLQDAAYATGIQLGRIEKSPMDGLIEYFG